MSNACFAPFLEISKWCLLLVREETIPFVFVILLSVQDLCHFPGTFNPFPQYLSWLLVGESTHVIHCWLCLRSALPSLYSLQLKPLPLKLGRLTGCFKIAAVPEQSIVHRISPYVSLIKLLLPWPLLLPTEVWFIYLKIWFVSFYYCVCEVTDIRFGGKELPFTSRLWWLCLGLQAWFWALVCPGAPTEIRLLAITASTALNNRHNSESIKLA